MKVVNVQGRKKTGKTTTVTNIIAELCRRGYSVGSTKSIHIEGFRMDSENADTGKHRRAGANPVTARSHDETCIIFDGKMNLSQVLRHYDTDWVVIESHVDLRCPNVVTGRTAEYSGEGKDVSLEGQINELTIACSGVISNELTEFKGLPVVNATTDIGRLVDLIEAAYDNPVEPGLVEENPFISIGKDGTETGGVDKMLTESVVEVSVDGAYAGSIPCTPQYIRELVTGWILAEGYIDSAEDLVDLSLSEDGTEAQVTTKRAGGDRAGRRRPVMKPVEAAAWKKEWIYSLAEDFEVILPLRQETMAAHSCRLATGKDDGIEVIFRCEDIGRHSAIDKAVGWALNNGINMQECILFTSGRVSNAMVGKVIRAGIPVMAGKGTISKKAVELADRNNLTLIGYAGRDSICVFAGGGPK